jgi:hypothetical protein
MIAGTSGIVFEEEKYVFRNINIVQQGSGQREFSKNIPDTSSIGS